MALLLSLAGPVFRRPRLAGVANPLSLGGLGLHLAAGVTRWIVTGHAPVMQAYENSLSGSWFVGLIFFALAYKLPALRRALPAALVVVILLLGNGLMAPQSLTPLEPPFRSPWLAVHVIFAWFAFGSYLVASIIAGLFLRGHRRLGPSAGQAAARKLGSLDDTCGRLIAFGFAADTVMIASGAIWAHGLWGRYWAWDPIETWSLISWLIYGVNLHLRFTLGWRGKRAAWLALLSVLAVIITFFGIGVISDVHTELL